MELDSYSFVLLKRGPRADEFSDEELDRLQEQHLAHLRAMAEQGHLLIAGPFSDQPDESLRGFCLYRTDLEETRRLAESDPVRPGGPDGCRRHDLVDEARERSRPRSRPGDAPAS